MAHLWAIWKTPIFCRKFCKKSPSGRQGWVWEPEMGVKVFKCVWRTWDECEGPVIEVKGFDESPKPSSCTPDPLQYTHPRYSVPPRPSRSPPHPTPIPTRSLPSEAPHTHKSLKYPSQALHTYLKPFTLISGPPHPPKALHTHLRYSMPILGTHTPFLCLLHLP